MLGADFDLDFERFEIRGQGHILLDRLEIAKRERQLRAGTAEQLTHRIAGRAVGGEPGERDLYQPGRHAFVPHRLDQGERQLELPRTRGGRDLEAMDTQALNAVGRRDDAAIERQVPALRRQLRLQVPERSLDLAVGLAIELPRHLELRHLHVEPRVLALQHVDLRSRFPALAVDDGAVETAAQPSLLPGEPRHQREHDRRRRDRRPLPGGRPPFPEPRRALARHQSSVHQVGRAGGPPGKACGPSSSSARAYTPRLK